MSNDYLWLKLYQCDQELLGRKMERVRIEQACEISLPARLAMKIGHCLVALGHRLERYGKQTRISHEVAS